MDDEFLKKNKCDLVRDLLSQVLNMDNINIKKAKIKRISGAKALSEYLDGLIKEV